jgi:hypothetical protein
MKTITVCCKALKEALQDVPNPSFTFDEEGRLYLTVGLVETEEGLGYLDQIANFCPFCGSKIEQ